MPRKAIADWLGPAEKTTADSKSDLFAGESHLSTHDPSASTVAVEPGNRSNREKPDDVTAQKGYL